MRGSSAGSPTAWVLSVNLHRRHLTQSQKAAVATESLPLFEAEAKERQAKAGEHKQKVREIIPQAEKGKATEKAAAAVGVNPRYVSDAKAIKEASPETFEKVKARPTARRIQRSTCGFGNGKHCAPNPQLAYA